MTTAYPDYTGKACPSCGFVRPAHAANPAWQCPQCHIAYHKVAALARVTGTGKALAAEAAHDNSAWSLLGANLFAIGVALATRMPLLDLLLVYWAQNVIIGMSFFIRILALRRFSTENFTINKRPVEETPEAKRRVALFFALHYGMFHTFYFMFLAFGTKAYGEGAGFDVWFWLCTLAFAVNHAFSLRHNLRLDREGRPNLGTLMFLPYARVIPMHLAVLLGGATPLLAGRTMLIFLGLKTGADLMMHAVEHHLLRKQAPSPSAARPTPP